MKKLIAIALAMLMLFASVAFAETADATEGNVVNVLMLTEPTLTMEQNGQTQAVDMTDLIIATKTGMCEGVPTINLDILNGSEQLFSAALQIANGNLLFEVDGIDQTYCIPMPAQMAGTAQQGYDMLFSSIPEMHNAKMSMIPAVTIPKVDIVTPLGMLLTDAGTEDGAQNYTFNVPYSMINAILAQVAPSVAVAGSEIPGIDQLQGLIDQLQQTNSGVNIQGTVTDTAEKTELVAEFYPVQNGEAAADPAGALVFMTSENDLYLEANVYQNGEYQTLGYMSLTSEPAEAAMNLTVDIMQQFSFNFDIYPEDNMQVLTVAVLAQGQTINFSFEYGDQDGVDVALLNASMPGMFEFALNKSSEIQEDGVKVGTIALSGEAQGTTLAVQANEMDYLADDVELRGVSNADGAVNLETLTEEEQQQFTASLQNAASGLINYLQSLTPRQIAA